ncbi:MAG: hypothetical protein ABIG61_17920 [Planctomycetota bacterium]
MKKLVLITGVLCFAASMALADYTTGLVARYDFESGDGSDSWGSNDLAAVGSPVIVNDGLLNQWWGYTGDPEWVGRSFLKVDTDAGKFQGTFADGSPMDLGTSADTSFTIWVRATGPQHRWVNQTHYVYADNAGDATHDDTRRYIYDQTYGADALDGFGDFQAGAWTAHYTSIDHGGDYYSWPDVHDMAYIWDGSTNTAYGWNDVTGRVMFVNEYHDPLYAYGDVTWILGAKHGDKGVAEWQSYIDEIRYYDAALLDYQLSMIEPARPCGYLGYYPGDVDKDCYVNMKDLAALAEQWVNCTMPGGAGCNDLGYPWTTP